MDRKLSSIITDIVTLNRDVNNLKSEQPFGYDSTLLKLAQNDNQYDRMITFNSGDRKKISIASRKAGSYEPSQSYSRNMYQIFVGDINTPYYGESSGIGVFTAYDLMVPYASSYVRTDLQIINSSSSTITIYIKIYCITTDTDTILTIGEY